MHTLHKAYPPFPQTTCPKITRSMGVPEYFMQIRHLVQKLWHLLAGSDRTDTHFPMTPVPLGG